MICVVCDIAIEKYNEEIQMIVTGKSEDEATS